MWCRSVEAEYKVILAVMRELHVSAFPVLDAADHVVGVVSEEDLLLKEVGQEPPVTIVPEDPVAGAARLMHDRRVKRLPVVDDAGRIRWAFGPFREGHWSWPGSWDGQWLIPRHCWRFWQQTVLTS